MQNARLSLFSGAVHSAWTSAVGLLFALMLTQSAQAVTVSLYSEVSSCPNQSLCEEPLLLIPNNRRMTVANVSCSIQHGAQAVEILIAQLHVTTASGNVLVRDTVVPTETGKGPLGTYFSFNVETILVLSPGQRLYISVSTDAISSFFIQCKIAGDWRAV